MYINPPYAEAASVVAAIGTGDSKTGVAKAHKTRVTYRKAIGAATNELSAQFMARIYHEIPMCTLALFSKLKFVCGQNFAQFRKFLNAEYKAGFVVRANTFDNVAGQFPIAFTVWDLNGAAFPKYIDVDVPENGGTKRFWVPLSRSINKWIVSFNKTVVNTIGYLTNPGPDFLHINQPYLTSIKGMRHIHYYAFDFKNLIPGCVYFSVRLCIEQTWLNDRDQFLYPNGGWETDTEFQHDCLMFTLFHGQNRVSAAAGVNHWIPFTEKEVSPKEKFQSNFMSGFLKGRQFSPEARAVMDAGRELWKYYHGKTKTNRTVSVNASFYDIRAHFQGRKESGTMNAASTDEIYNALIKTLRDAARALAKKIEPKVYEYGFLR
ncbi:MAG: hypothetical protein LBD24_06645 [Spirochaetaceae bacterium]|nr:hypothetical protein [Spirochaetaceae bacterium]